MRIKSIILAIAMILALRSLGSCAPAGSGLKITGSPAEMDGVTVTLEKASAVRKSKPDRYEYAFSGKITNNSDEGIMKVIYTFSIRDKSGEEFRSFGEVYDGVDKPIPAHGSVPFKLDGIKWGAQSVPASVEIGISSVYTETELPAMKLPQAGEHLYQVTGDVRLADIKNSPPVEMKFHVDRGGYGRTATFTEGPELDRAVELFCDILIAGETDEWVTDNYNWISFTWEDGSSTYLSLNRSNLELRVHSSPHMFTLKDLSPFWNYAEEYFKDD